MNNCNAGGCRAQLNDFRPGFLRGSGSFELVVAVYDLAMPDLATVDLATVDLTTADLTTADQK
jgi:uncharacterized protein YjbI with pentapeptide repeats